MVHDRVPCRSIWRFFFCPPPARSDVRFRGFQDVGGKNLVFKNPTDVRKTPRPPKAAEKFWPFFFVQNQDFSGGFFFDLSESEIFDISEFHGCKICSLFKSGGRKFQRKLKSQGREILRFFFGNYAEEG